MAYALYFKWVFVQFYQWSSCWSRSTEKTEFLIFKLMAFFQLFKMRFDFWYENEFMIHKFICPYFQRIWDSFETANNSQIWKCLFCSEKRQAFSISEITLKVSQDFSCKVLTFGMKINEMTSWLIKVLLCIFKCKCVEKSVFKKQTCEITNKHADSMLSIICIYMLIYTD